MKKTLCVLCVLIVGCLPPLPKTERAKPTEPVKMLEQPTTRTAPIVKLESKVEPPITVPDEPKAQPVTPQVERYRYAGLVRSILPTDRAGVYTMLLEDRQTVIKRCHCVLSTKPPFREGKVVEVSGVVVDSAGDAIWIKDVTIDKIIR